jgi:ABC-type sugar transport system permease subunit
MHEIKSFEIFQTATVIAAIHALTAAIFGVFFAFMALVHGHPGRAIETLIFFPILYAVASFIGAAFLCWLYNEVADRIGGVKFEMTPRSEI